MPIKIKGISSASLSCALFLWNSSAAATWALAPEPAAFTRRQGAFVTHQHHPLPKRKGHEKNRVFSTKIFETASHNQDEKKISKGDQKRRSNEPRKRDRTKTSSKLKSKSSHADNDTDEEPNSMHRYIQFSRVFQRHVVYQNNTNLDGISEGSNGNIRVMQSFEFLDEAMQHYPGVKVLAPKDLPCPPRTCSINNDESRSRGEAADVYDFETTVAGMGLTSLCELEYPLENVNQMEGWASADDWETYANEARRTLLDLVRNPETERNLPRHFFRLDLKRFAMRGLTSETIEQNYTRLIYLLGGVLKMKRLDAEFVLSNFPQLCLYDGEELKTIIYFLISPLPPEEYVSVFLVADKGIGGASVDWPMLASKGYGAGLTKAQAAAALRLMPELLALYYEDSLKPSIFYMRTSMQLKLDPDLLDETATNLGNILEGTSSSDMFFFGVSWGQLRILTASLKLWCNCNLDPSWEILQQDQVRRVLKNDALDYLRLRLQVTPSDVHKMIKTHARLTGYDACFNMKPTLAKLQSTFALTSGDIRQLVLRMPSLIGMSTQSIDGKLQFFTAEANTTKKQIRNAMLKQPSLIQYSIDTLRAKLNFFVDELGIDPSLLPRIVTSTPALMGYSLTDNLRPKLCYIMMVCVLDQFQVGIMVATSPSILTLSRRANIAPTLARLSELLHYENQNELGKFVMAAPRVLLHSVSSLNNKFNLLEDALQSTSKTIEIIRKNPSLMTWSLTKLRERIDHVLDSNGNLYTSLKPSKKGRPRLITQLPRSAKYENNAVIVSSNELKSFDSIELICPTVDAAAKKIGEPKSVVTQAIDNGQFVKGKYFSYVRDFKEPKTVGEDSPANINVTSLSIYAAGNVHPSDSQNFARGQRKTGAVSLHLLEESHIDEFCAIATKLFGGVVPNPSGNAILLVYPLLNASKNRCDLFSLWASLRVVEYFVKKKRREQGGMQQYDIRVFSDSNYAMELVTNTDRLLKLGSTLMYSEDLLSSLYMNRAYSNLDILHPLARTFSRLNGQDEPPQSRNEKVDGSKVRFFHSSDGLGGADLAKLLKLQAKSAAKWQHSKQ